MYILKKHKFGYRFCWDGGNTKHFGYIAFGFIPALREAKTKHLSGRYKDFSLVEAFVPLPFFLEGVK